MYHDMEGLTNKSYAIGLDVGSTTLKCVVRDADERIVYRSYQRHYSKIAEQTATALRQVQEQFPDIDDVQLCVSGSAGMGIAERCELPFVQEVYATRIAVSRFMPATDVVIELGGEDAKILFLTGGIEVRMNGSCAGGTGAFIDQMATLLGVSVEEMDHLAAQHEKQYTIASRCGVFAKSDIQPLLNQGARKPDICSSIFAAVVNQTISGLAQGRPIRGNVLYLGGPLSFLSQLREEFDRTLKTRGICPEDALYYVALGAAFAARENEKKSLERMIQAIEHYSAADTYLACAPLFADRDEYERFRERHAQSTVPLIDPAGYRGQGYLGIDVGSTTVKAVVISEDGDMLYTRYLTNSGNPTPIVLDFLRDFYTRYPHIPIRSSAVTGYGEQLVQFAFGVDMGIVETMAHFTAAKKFRPDVDFIIDIGGQDIKCFQIRNGAIDSIFLNEACSSGCGSFLQTFANAMGMDISEFAQLGLFADKPVDLGSRCTVFMNSSVKQAQKDGASLENIAAGLCISVVKNAIYKVIRAPSADSLGKNIVVQGGTFLNDSVLRAFEMELNQNVIRPSIAGLMGAYGAALWAQAHVPDAASTLLGPDALASFTHEVSVTPCKLCANHCMLTYNHFGTGRSFISGNRCSRPVSDHNKKAETYNMYDFKLSLLKKYRPVPGRRGKIGIPMGLNLYELLPFWHTFFTRLGFEVVTSPLSSRKLYLNGQHTIPSDTVCFPAKLMHGHIDALIKADVPTIFYPCMSYNFDEHLGHNHYNCPVVAYYPEVIAANVPELKDVRFIYDYIAPHRKRDFPKKMLPILQTIAPDLTLREVRAAAAAAADCYQQHMRTIREQGEKFIAIAHEKKLPIIVLAGRPYHLDPEVNHGIDQLFCEFGAVVVSEDSVCTGAVRRPTNVLNQWTYHARLYAAAHRIATEDDMYLVQLVSFGCGVDAITTDEVRETVERTGNIYTQIKIDEITNLGAVRIRIRSLLAATGHQV